VVKSVQSEECVHACYTERLLYDRTPACTVYMSTAALHPVPGTPGSRRAAQGHESLAETGRHEEAFALLIPPSRAHTKSCN
jgi:hypothetical protein